MTRIKLFAWAVALAAALPFAAVAEDAPGVFKIPGTETTLKIYGFARFDLAYDVNQQNGWASDILNAKVSDYADAALTDPTGDPQFATTPMSAANSRFGFQTITPSAVGPIEVKIEGDFASNFRIRHGYGTINNTVLIGQTWGTWRDGNAQPDTVDWGGNYSSGGFRRPQIRAMFKAGESVDVFLAAEKPNNPLGGKKQIPDFVAGVSVPMSWGHVSLRGALEPLKDAADKSAIGYAVALSGHLEFSGDTLIFEVMGGAGAEANLDILNSQLNGDGICAGYDTSGNLAPYQAVSYTLGYTHVWTPTIRSNLVLAGGFIKNDENTRPGSPASALGQISQNFIQGFANVYYSPAKNADLGLEYTWQQKTDFFNNKYVISRIGFAATYNFF